MSVSASVSRLRAVKRFEPPRSSISASPSGSAPLTWGTPSTGSSVTADISLLEVCDQRTTVR
ncbi:MAG TPA: hypothetical protein VF080_12415, partial [Solirubrobacteraceae bacterium]